MIRAARLVPTGEDPDWQLVAAARTRDEAAIRELVQRMNPRLFRIARGILPTDAEAEEAVQDAYLAAFTRLDSFRGDARFSTWITRITINAARMQARRPRPDRDQQTVTDDLASVSAYQEIAQTMQANRVDRHIETTKLTDSQRQLLQQSELLALPQLTAYTLTC